jgi:hypothetical protein
VALFFLGPVSLILMQVDFIKLAPNVHPKLISLEASFIVKNARCQKLPLEVSFIVKNARFSFLTYQHLCLQEHGSNAYPQELEVFVDKRMFFKVSNNLSFIFYVFC